MSGGNKNSVNRLTVAQHDDEDQDEDQVEDAALAHEVMHTRGRAAAMEHVAMHTSIRKGLEEHGSRAYAAVIDELTQLMHVKKVMHPVERSSLGAKESKKNYKIIHVFEGEV